MVHFVASKTTICHKKARLQLCTKSGLIRSEFAVLRKNTSLPPVWLKNTHRTDAIWMFEENCILV